MLWQMPTFPLPFLELLHNDFCHIHFQNNSTPLLISHEVYLPKEQLFLLVKLDFLSLSWFSEIIFKGWANYELYGIVAV